MAEKEKFDKAKYNAEFIKIYRQNSIQKVVYFKNDDPLMEFVQSLPKRSFNEYVRDLIRKDMELKNK